MLVSKDTVIQIRRTLGATNSEFSNISKMIENCMRYVEKEDLYSFISSSYRMSILTPDGFRPIGFVDKIDNKRLIKIEYCINGTDRGVSIIPEDNCIQDFTTGEIVKVQDLTDKNSFITYTNTDTDCKGFRINRAIAVPISVRRSMESSDTYHLINFSELNKRAFIDRISCVWL